MGIETLINLFDPAKNIFNCIFKKRKLTILTWKCSASYGDTTVYALTTLIKNDTTSSITIKEIKYGIEEWKCFDSEPVLFYGKGTSRIGPGIEASQRTFIPVGESCFKNGGVMIKDINNKIYKSKHIDTVFQSK